MVASLGRPGFHGPRADRRHPTAQWLTGYLMTKILAGQRPLLLKPGWLWECLGRCRLIAIQKELNQLVSAKFLKLSDSGVEYLA
jgi:hypothetical protein